MRTRAMAFPLAGLAVAALLALGLAACGSGGSSAPGTVAAKPPKAGTPAPHEGSPNAKPTQTCETQLSGFLSALQTLRRRLVAGVTYEQYVSEIEAIRSAYEAVPVAKLDVACLTRAGSPAESSFNTYIEAGNDWGECVGTAGCEATTVEPVLQRRWRLASKALSEAQAAM
ncbi:MAG TPA: hypothetical protein VF731_07195 [Solirubrobacterales bacterium]